jgi:hypothetical protein
MDRLFGDPESPLIGLYLIFIQMDDLSNNLTFCLYRANVLQSSRETTGG